MYIWPITLSDNADGEVQFSNGPGILKMNMALCLIRGFEIRKQITRTARGTNTGGD